LGKQSVPDEYSQLNIGNNVKMILRIFTEPQQGASYDDLLAVAQRGEQLGFDGFFRSDHYLKMGDHVSGEPGPSDAWITLAGLARETSTIRLGTLVSSATFRNPGVLAISVANVDNMSGGRVELGLGAGWYVDEHTGYGIPFPSLGERFDILSEQLAIVDGLWRTKTGDTFSFDGDHYTVTHSPALPKPVQSPPPIIIGGGGPRKTPALAAAYASEFNVPFRPVSFVEEQFLRVRHACETIGRDPDSMRYSIAQVFAIGANDAEIAQRARAIGREVNELKENGLCGTPSEIIDKIVMWADHGVQSIYLQMLDLSDLEHLDIIAADVMSHLP
jgi:alkanesulfonate monooxygenase